MAEVNPRTYNGWHRGIGDASNSPVLELLVAGELTETYPRSIHIAQASAANTDWNVAAAANPTIYLHSTTTPATDYVRMDHDGTDADIDAVGATNLNLQIAGTTVAQVQANALTLPTDDDFIALGASDDFQLLWSDGDASNHAAVIAIGDTSQQLHITDVGAKATDWNVSAATHPELYIHSNTTPATDYIRIGAHDGTTAYVDVVGGTTLALQIAGASTVTMTATALAAIDDVLISVGTGSTARISWDTTDANANELLIQLPAGGATDVPVIVIGDTLESDDLGLFNGVVSTTVAIMGSTATATGPSLNFRKSRGTNSAPTVVTSGDDLGSLDFYGAVAADEYVRAARILVEMTGTIGTTQGPGVITIQTATDAGPSVLTTAVTISAAQVVTLAAGVTTGNHTFSNTITAGADGVGADAEQLTSGGAGAECDWAAAGSLREFKDLGGERRDYAAVLATMVATPVYDFHYKPKHKGMEDRPITTGDTKTTYTGVMADEAPWAMHHRGRIFNPSNAFGHTVLAIKALAERLERLEAAA